VICVDDEWGRAMARRDLVHARMLDPRWGPLTEDRLTRDLTIVQRARGHRTQGAWRVEQHQRQGLAALQCALAAVLAQRGKPGWLAALRRGGYEPLQGHLQQRLAMG